MIIFVSVADLIRVSMRLRTPDPLHQHDLRCICPDCARDRICGCRQPYACAQEAVDRLNMIAPKFNPLKRDNHGNLSLTRRRIERNEITKATQGYPATTTGKRTHTAEAESGSDPTTPGTKPSEFPETSNQTKSVR